MAPAWNQLGEAFKDHASIIIGDTDCTLEKGKSVCTEVCVCACVFRVCACVRVCALM